MSPFNHFACELKEPNDAPEPFRTALAQALPDGARLFILTPPSELSRLKHGPMVLAVTNGGWVCVEHTRRGDVLVSRSDFAHTVLVEMTGVLLSGVFKIDYAESDGVRTVAMEFNTASEQLYWEALQLLLHGISGMPPGPPVDRRTDLSLLEPWPLKFLNSTWSGTPSNEHVRTITHWPAAVATYSRWFQRKLAPEAIIALSEHELIFVAEEKARWSIRSGYRNRYGDVATYIPFSRLRNVHLDAANPLGKLELTVGVAEASETVVIEYPAEHRRPIRELIKRAFIARAACAEPAESN